MLWTVFSDLVCEGVHLELNSRDVLVDLPCSGARLLSLTGAMFAGLCAIRRPSGLNALIGACISVLTLVIANSLRISLLAIGIAYRESLGVNVMDALPHTLLGLVGTCLSATALYRWSLSFDPTPTAQLKNLSVSEENQARSHRPIIPGHSRLMVAAAILIAAIVIVNLTPAPIDARPASDPPELPLALAGLHRSSASLTDLEALYYTQYGGSAARARYGPYALLVVQTASPLRHLHDPQVCMSGMGYDVKFLGTNSANATALYRATDPDQRSYTVEVSYVSTGLSTGMTAHLTQASSISEVVWRWLKDPDQHWQMIQKIIPEDPAIAPEATHAWRQSAARAFDLKMET